MYTIIKDTFSPFLNNQMTPLQVNELGRDIAGVVSQQYKSGNKVIILMSISVESVSDSFIANMLPHPEEEGVDAVLYSDLFGYDSPLHRKIREHLPPQIMMVPAC